MTPMFFSFNKKRKKKEKKIHSVNKLALLQFIRSHNTSVYGGKPSSFNGIHRNLNCCRTFLLWRLKQFTNGKHSYFVIVYIFIFICNKTSLLSTYVQIHISVELTLIIFNKLILLVNCHESVADWRAQHRPHNCTAD